MSSVADDNIYFDIIDGDIRAKNECGGVLRKSYITSGIHLMEIASSFVILLDKLMLCA
jgi:hypothetical protein